MFHVGGALVHVFGTSVGVQRFGDLEIGTMWVYKRIFEGCKYRIMCL